MIIDIDPSDKNTFDQVIESANAFKRVLDKAGAKSFCKTSGASGLHIYVPMGKKYDYEEVKNFAQLLCMIVCDELPTFTTMERNLKKRGNKKIYLDHLQNRRSQTISSVYSVRPKKGATVSMPLQWKEVKKGLKPTDFTIHNAHKKNSKTSRYFQRSSWSGYQYQFLLKETTKVIWGIYSTVSQVNLSLIGLKPTVGGHLKEAQYSFIKGGLTAASSRKESCTNSKIF